MAEEEEGMKIDKRDKLIAEMLRDEAIRTAQRANAAGVHVELELWPETPHVFQVASFLPESAQALDHIVRFVREHTGWRTTNPAQ